MVTRSETAKNAAKERAPSRSAKMAAKRMESSGKFLMPGQDRKSAPFPPRVELERLTRLKQDFSIEEIYALVAPRRTLERRMEQGSPLSPVESDRVVRLERISTHAIRVFGNRDKAHRWLRKPCRALNGAVPLDLLASETGAFVVEGELHAIDFGMFV